MIPTSVAFAFRFGAASFSTRVSVGGGGGGGIETWEGNARDQRALEHDLGHDLAGAHLPERHVLALGGPVEGRVHPVEEEVRRTGVEAKLAGLEPDAAQ